MYTSQLEHGHISVLFCRQIWNRFCSCQVGNLTTLVKPWLCEPSASTAGWVSTFSTRWVCPPLPDHTWSMLTKQGPLLISLSIVIGQFCSQGKVYLSILEDTGFWLENKVLSFIQDQEEEYLKLHKVVYQQIIQVRSLTTWKPSLHQVWDVLPDFIFCFKVITLDSNTVLQYSQHHATSRACLFPKHKHEIGFHSCLWNGIKWVSIFLMEIKMRTNVSFWKFLCKISL